MAQRFWQSFGDRYKEEVKNRVKAEGKVIEVILELFAKFKDHSCQEQSPLAAGFLQYTVQLNQQILRGYNHSLEIALYIDKLRKLEETQLIQIISYSSDKDRLELELRKCLLTRMIELPSFSFEEEKHLSSQLATFFGKNFSHRFNLILNELQENVKSNEQGFRVMPSAVWANELCNPHRAQIIHPELMRLTDPFTEQYKLKYKNRGI